MKNFRRLALVFILALSVMALFSGCKGKTGPTGPAGEKGDTGVQGPKGDPGDPGGGGLTKTLLTGSVPTDSGQFFVQIPGLTTENLPLISAFIQVSEGEYDELPWYWADYSNQPAWASLDRVRGGLTLYNCPGLSYIIVVIQ